MGNISTDGNDTDEFAKLEKLHADGVISQQEFDKLKSTRFRDVNSQPIRKQAADLRGPSVAPDKDWYSAVVPNEIVWKQVIPIGWFLIWRIAAGILFINIILGFLLASALTILLHLRQETIHLLFGVILPPLDVLWSLAVIQLALNKKYSTFRLEVRSNAQQGAKS
jgi:cytochrome c oxidase subunit IV